MRLLGRFAWYADAGAGARVVICLALPVVRVPDFE